MRKIEMIVVHCTAGNQQNSATDVVAYHCRTLGWSRPGYHYIVEADGKTVATLGEEFPSNGVRGYNGKIINVCYTGGVDLKKPGHPPVDNRTEAQRLALRGLLKELRLKYPKAVIVGHRDLNGAKACPSFDAREEYKEL